MRNPGDARPPLRDGDARRGPVDSRVPSDMRIPGRQSSEVNPIYAALGGIRAKAAELLGGDHDLVDVLDINERDLDMLILLRTIGHGEALISVINGRLGKVTQTKEAIDFSKESFLPLLLAQKTPV